MQFYARQGAVPDENGKYSDYIGVVDDDWLIEPDCGSTFMGVYASEDCQPSQIYKDRVLPYVENGKAIGINQIDFESGNYSTEDYPEENGPTLRELLDICQLCMDDSEDEECLYRLGMGTEPIPSGSFLDNHGNWASLDSARYNIDGCPNRDFALLPVRAMITDDDEQWDLIAEFDIEKDEVPDLPFITMYDEEFQDYEVDDGEDWLQLGYGSGNLLDADGNTIQSLKDVDHADNEDGETVFWRVPYADLDEDKRKSGEYVLTEEARKKWSEKLGL